MTTIKQENSPNNVISDSDKTASIFKSNIAIASFGSACSGLSLIWLDLLTIKEGVFFAEGALLTGIIALGAAYIERKLFSRKNHDISI